MGIEQVTSKAGELAHVVEVSAGDLSLAAARMVFSTKVSVQVSIRSFTHTPALRDQLEEELQKLAASTAGVAKEDVDFSCAPAAGADAATNVDCTGTFRATGTRVANSKVSDWQSKMMPLVGIGNVVNDADSIEMNSVIHGIDYSQV